ncbi:MAG: sulfurtransferase [Candidatus Binatia bacterium]|nr:sulfurtransferase [Candidatus Binatia bacterium]
MDDREYTDRELLTTPDTVRGIMETPGLCLIDTRPAEQFARGHIPGAFHFDLYGLSLIDTNPAPLNAFLSMIHHLFELRGAGLEKEVVFYEETSGMRAARGLWFLHTFGHKRVRLLDGGIRAWHKMGLPISTQPATPEAAQLKMAERRDLLATVDDVLAALKDESPCIVDARSEDEYKARKIRAARGGAIPGAVHIEWLRNLDGEGKFKPAEELKTLYADAGVTADKEIIAYCQGGYRSAHTYLALKLLGYPRIRNYLGSWKEWGDRVDLPLENP